MSFDNLGDRMKAYEAVPQVGLMRRTPVILRADGKAFHSFTAGMEKPYDRELAQCMWEAARYALYNMQGAKLAYVQSDEISVLLTDYDTLQTDGWFDYNVQKMTSVGASLVTIGFYTEFLKRFPHQATKRPHFDARVYNVPLHEVNNYFIWRQQDATRNSINGLGQRHFSHTELQRKTTSQVQEMLFQAHGINWNDCPVEQKRGVCIRKVTKEVAVINPLTNQPTTTQRYSWQVDLEIPIFTQDRDYIERYAAPPEKESNAA